MTLQDFALATLLCVSCLPTLAGLVAVAVALTRGALP